MHFGTTRNRSQSHKGGRKSSAGNSMASHGKESELDFEMPKITKKNFDLLVLDPENDGKFQLFNTYRASGY
jgi:hypothetical protein